MGDKLVVRIELRSDRDMEYVHLKDMRGAGFEPINVLSRYKWQDGLGYYEATGDAATNFIDYLRKGTYASNIPAREPGGSFPMASPPSNACTRRSSIPIRKESGCWCNPEREVFFYPRITRINTNYKEWKGVLRWKGGMVP